MKRHRLISAVAAIGLLVAAPVAAGSAGDRDRGRHAGEPGRVPGAGRSSRSTTARSLLRRHAHREHHFLTAAHCVDGDFGRRLDLRPSTSGPRATSRRNQISDFYGVAGVDVHPGYDALRRPTERPRDAARSIGPAPYAAAAGRSAPTRARIWAPGTTATIIGWGHDLSRRPGRAMRCSKRPRRSSADATVPSRLRPLQRSIRTRWSAPATGLRTPARATAAAR